MGDSKVAAVPATSAPNPMLGSQLICKSIRSPAKKADSHANQSSSLPNSKVSDKINNNHLANGHQDKDPSANNKIAAQQLADAIKSETDKSQPQSTSVTSERPNGSREKQQARTSDQSYTSSTTTSTTTDTTSINSTNNNCQKDGARLKSVLCQTQQVQLQQVEHHALETGGPNQNNHCHQTGPDFGGLSARDSELLAKETQELKIRTRKLQLEIEEKNEIINVLKDELETLREQSDKFQRENIQLVKDAKRVQFLQDENDFLQDKVNSVEKLELEIKRLKEKLNELDFMKLRVTELEEDRNKAQEESAQFEERWQKSEAKLARVGELEIELNKWKTFSQELEQERNTIQGKLLESIEHESELNLTNKKVEDEVKRLRNLVKSFEEQRDEEQASNSLIMSVADLKQIDEEQHHQPPTQIPKVDLKETGQQTDICDTVEKAVGPDISCMEGDGKLTEENQCLKEQLHKRDGSMKELIESNESIRNELEGNRRLISDLRQDLACEKSLAQKLANQLTNFTKQIKSLDRQYFPMHDLSSTSETNVTKNLNTSDKIHGSNLNKENGNESSQLKCVSLSERTKQQQQNQRLSPHEKDVLFEKSAAANKSFACSAEADELETNSFIKPKNGETKETDNESQQQVELKNALLESTKKESTTMTKSDSRLGQVEDSKTSVATDGPVRRSSPSLNDDGSDIKQALTTVTTKNLLKIAIAQPAKGSESNAVNSAKASSPIGTANKSAGSVTLGKNDLVHKDINESCKGKLLPTSKNNNPVKQFACNSTKSQQQQYESNSGRSVLARDDSHSPMIDSSEDELKTGRKHVRTIPNNGTINNQDKFSTTNTTVTTNIQRVTTRNGASSTSPNSSGRSQSSSPHSVAVTIGHDSGFQSINHDAVMVAALLAGFQPRQTTNKFCIPKRSSFTSQHLLEDTSPRQIQTHSIATGTHMAHAKIALAAPSVDPTL